MAPFKQLDEGIGGVEIGWKTLSTNAEDDGCFGRGCNGGRDYVKCDRRGECNQRLFAKEI